MKKQSVILITICFVLAIIVLVGAILNTKNDLIFYVNDKVKAIGTKILKSILKILLNELVTEGVHQLGNVVTITPVAEEILKSTLESYIQNW
ncbi:hypothetical protein ILYODFUR_017555 [Ilyodon furcidens]|uniref:Uncharacterized protein n=1 Tax=Ilyodon furcidens TaxID=33524 RepID=A0ABV0UT54_9TELE